MCIIDTYSNRIIIDWISFTASDEFELSDILNIELEFIDSERGMMGYKSMRIDNLTKIKNLKDGNPGMGQHFIFSGETCRAIEYCGCNLLDFLSKLSTISDITITRLDIAYDIFNNKHLLSDITEAYNNGYYNSKMKSSNIIISRSATDRVGTTFNFGSRQSSVMIRIYDKGAERDINVDWVRIEIEIKDKKYNRKILQNIENIGLSETYKGLLNNYIKFLEYKDKNITRSPTAKWWDKIINSASKIKLYEAPESRNLDDVKAWLLSQTSASLATVVQGEQSHDFLNEMIRTGTQKMKNKHWNMIE